VHDAHALIVRRAHAHGTAIWVAGAQIAAIASMHGFTVATRDVAPFAATGLLILNPWDARRWLLARQ
jgi:predicted nucleic acid-binding protein